MRVVYYSRKRAVGVPDWCEYIDSLEGLCRESDVLSVHVPLREETVHLVGEKEIRAMKKGGIIVNTARGKVVDEEAMIRALEDGHVRRYLIFFSSLSEICAPSSSRLLAWTCTQMSHS
jgi:phosphoglycerate dehydrogenase-like enzyme